jgi:hypothetical protein
MAKFCSCGALLTKNERDFYGDMCEDCVVAECDRLDAWRNGAEDEELDDLYGEQP